MKRILLFLSAAPGKIKPKKKKTPTTTQAHNLDQQKKNSLLFFSLQVLFTEGGYTYLDVRPEYELDEAGKVRNCVNVPVYTAENKYDAAAGKKLLKKFPNDKFIAQVEKKIPNKETKLIVGCSDGKSYSMDALGALDEAGYVNMVALKGGYYAWFRCWDNNLRRRRGDGYTEVRRFFYDFLDAFLGLFCLFSPPRMHFKSSASLRRVGRSKERGRKRRKKSSRNLRKKNL